MIECRDVIDALQRNEYITIFSKKSNLSAARRECNWKEDIVHYDNSSGSNDTYICQ